MLTKTTSPGIRTKEDSQVHPLICWAEQAGPGDHRRSGRGTGTHSPHPGSWVFERLQLLCSAMLTNHKTQTQSILKQPAEWQDEKYCHKITGLRLVRGGQGCPSVLRGNTLLSNHLINITETQSSNRIPPPQNVHKYLVLQLCKCLLTNQTSLERFVQILEATGYS